MEKLRAYELSSELLAQYRDAALINANELLTEATLLYQHEHFPRAYFLSLASIEETGKAYMAFEAIGRNLKDPGVCKKIKELFEDHSSKITSAFVGWLHSSNNSRESLKKAIELSVHLKFGREKSMYVDVKQKNSQLSIPNVVVRPVAAKDCISLASNCLVHMRTYFELNTPEKRTSFNDKFMCINKNKRTDILNSEAFWEYFITELENGNSSLEESLVKFHDGKISNSVVLKSKNS